MEPQINRELPKVGGNFSSEGFETVVPVNEIQPSAEQIQNSFNDHERAFSAVEKFQPNFENLQATAQTQIPPVLPQVQQADAQQVIISTPSIAKDIDLMEDEWVKDLKKMIVETKGEPFIRQVRFKEMQVDYLKKRYNRIINGGK